MLEATLVGGYSLDDADAVSCRARCCALWVNPVPSPCTNPFRMQGNWSKLQDTFAVSPLSLADQPVKACWCQRPPSRPWHQLVSSKLIYQACGRYHCGALMYAANQLSKPQQSLPTELRRNLGGRQTQPRSCGADSTCALKGAVLSSQKGSTNHTASTYVGMGMQHPAQLHTP